jgi:hypothetical protein
MAIVGEPAPNLVAVVAQQLRGAAVPSFPGVLVSCKSLPLSKSFTHRSRFAVLVDR